MSYETSVFRNIDRPSIPQEVQIKFERWSKPDESPDLSFLMQDYEDDSISPEDRAKYREQDRLRLAAYNLGEWEMRGLFVRASIMVPIGGGSFTIFELNSAGLWGIESDCGEAYESEVYADQERELREAMRLMGAAFSTLSKEA